MDTVKSPIILLAYNKSEEFQKSLESLSRSNNSSKYRLFVHIDGVNVFKNDDFESIKIIKETCETYKDRFAYLKVYEERFHRGLAESVISFVSDIIKKYGKVIVIEDDLILAKDCIDFLSEGLEYYEFDKNIWSLTGYCPPLNSINESKHSVFLHYRASSLAWATWRDRWESVDWELDDFDNDEVDERMNVFSKGGYDLPIMLTRQMYGLLDSWAVRWCYSQSKRNMMTVYPMENRVYHMTSEKGTHVTRDFPQTQLKKEYGRYKFEDYINENIISEFNIFQNMTEMQLIAWKRNDYNSIYKFEAMVNVLSTWKEIALDGHNIAEYFINRGYKDIAIYGKGRIGKYLRRELIGTEVSVLYFIDKDQYLKKDGDCYLPDDDYPRVDVIIITTMEGLWLTRKKLISKQKGAVKSILDVVKDR
ncbi:MAG: hypothetical protein E7232_10485 [Lachnospiraceae bacterium]|nr:hypothetical protein [Lachnospiraceae bacterium]